MPISEQDKSRFAQSATQSMAHTSVIDYIRMMAEQARDKKRHNAQVDAAMRCKYGDLYQPPEEEEDDMTTNIIYNSVLGDDAIKQFGVDLPSDGSTPTPTPTPRPENGENDRVERRKGWIAAAILIGAMVISLSMMLIIPEILDALYSLEPRPPREAIYEVE